jgi:hypothetical protein
MRCVDNPIFVKNFGENVRTGRLIIHKINGEKPFLVVKKFSTIASMINKKEREREGGKKISANSISIKGLLQVTHIAVRHAMLFLSRPVMLNYVRETNLNGRGLCTVVLGLNFAEKSSSTSRVNAVAKISNRTM